MTVASKRENELFKGTSVYVGNFYASSTMPYCVRGMCVRRHWGRFSLVQQLASFADSVSS